MPSVGARTHASQQAACQPDGHLGGCMGGRMASDRGIYGRILALDDDTRDGPFRLVSRHFGLSSGGAPGRIRTCAHGSGGRDTIRSWPAETCPPETLLDTHWARADSRRSRPCRPPAVFHMPGVRPRREPDPPPGIPHRVRRGWRACAGDPGRLALGRRLAMLWYDAGACTQSSSGRPRRRPANLGAQVCCHGLGITESQQPACTDASRFHSDLPNICWFSRVVLARLANTDHPSLRVYRWLDVTAISGSGCAGGRPRRRSVPPTRTAHRRRRAPSPSQPRP